MDRHTLGRPGSPRGRSRTKTASFIRPLASDHSKSSRFSSSGGGQPRMSFRPFQVTTPKGVSDGEPPSAFGQVPGGAVSETREISTSSASKRSRGQASITPM